jgi:hypothetical protein
MMYREIPVKIRVTANMIPNPAKILELNFMDFIAFLPQRQRAALPWAALIAGMGYFL